MVQLSNVSFIGQGHLSGPPARYILTLVPLHHVYLLRANRHLFFAAIAFWADSSYTSLARRPQEQNTRRGSSSRPQWPETSACTLHLLPLVPPLPNPQLQ